MRFRFGAPIVLALVLGNLLALLPRALNATEPSLSGRWQAGPMIARWRIGDWGKACGPEPSGGSDNGGLVLIAETGNELTITGVGRTYSTGQCWQEFPGLTRSIHQAGARNWQSTCETEANDPRRATLKTRISATDSSISFEETAQYQFVIQKQNCTASSGLWRTYTLVQRATDPNPIPTEAPAVTPEPAASEPAPAEATASASNDRCETLGSPARLEVRPSRKLMRAGEAFRFRAVVLDDKGCTLTAKPRWSIAEGNGSAQVTATGELSIAENAPDGDVKLHVGVANTEVTVVAVVAAKDRYDALLTGGGFNPSGEVETTASGSIASASVSAEPAVGKDSSGARKALFVTLVFTIALVLGGVGLFYVRRTRIAYKKQTQAQRAAHELALAEHALAQRKSEEQREQLRQEQRARALRQTPKHMICPICGKLYPTPTKFCVKDGTVLLPVN